MPCRIRVHHVRDRKTGPCFPITVVHCLKHGRAFTLYPLGHVPYGRVAIAPVGADGEPLCGERLDPWRSTLFVAALDAASGRAWTRTASAGSRWETQLDYLDRGAGLVGLRPGLEASVGERIACALDVPRLVQMEAARRYQAARGYRARGSAVVAILECLRSERCLCDRLLAAGALGGCWGTVTRWDPGRAFARASVFGAAGTPRGKGASGPVTKSPS